MSAPSSHPPTPSTASNWAKSPPIRADTRKTAIFCHNNPWISIANAIAGNDDEAFAVYQRNCPAYVEDKSDVRKVEPYVLF